MTEMDYSLFSPEVAAQLREIDAQYGASSIPDVGIEAPPVPRPDYYTDLVSRGVMPRKSRV